MRIRATMDTADDPAPQSLDSGAVRPEGQALFEMANLRPERTGLPFVVFISQKGGARHDVRVKIAHGAKVRPSEMVTVAIRPRLRVISGALNPGDLELLGRWVALNRDTLIGYWD